MGFQVVYEHQRGRSEECFCSDFFVVVPAAAWEGVLDKEDELLIAHFLIAVDDSYDLCFLVSLKLVFLG